MNPRGLFSWLALCLVRASRSSSRQFSSQSDPGNSSAKHSIFYTSAHCPGITIKINNIGSNLHPFGVLIVVILLVLCVSRLALISLWYTRVEQSDSLGFILDQGLRFDVVLLGLLLAPLVLLLLGCVMAIRSTLNSTYSFDLGIGDLRKRNLQDDVGTGCNLVRDIPVGLRHVATSEDAEKMSATVPWTHQQQRHR